MNLGLGDPEEHALEILLSKEKSYGLLWPDRQTVCVPNCRPTPLKDGSLVIQLAPRDPSTQSPRRLK